MQSEARDKDGWRVGMSKLLSDSEYAGGPLLEKVGPQVGMLTARFLLRRTRLVSVACYYLIPQRRH